MEVVKEETKEVKTTIELPQVKAIFCAYEDHEVKNLTNAQNMSSAIYNFYLYIRGLNKHTDRDVEDIYARFNEEFYLFLDD